MGSSLSYKVFFLFIEIIIFMKKNISFHVNNLFFHDCKLLMMVRLKITYPILHEDAC